MKLIPRKTIGEFSVETILKEVCSIAPNGMTIAQMRSRIRVLDAVDAPGDIVLEDTDYTTAADAINGMSWARADKNLLAVIDEILSAKEPLKDK